MIDAIRYLRILSPTIVIISSVEKWFYSPNMFFLFELFGKNWRSKHFKTKQRKFLWVSCFYSLIFCLFCRITKAYKVLSDESLRKDYDKWMNSGLCVSYEKWTELSKATHTSLHWGCMKNQQLALTKGDEMMLNIEM